MIDLRRTVGPERVFLAGLMRTSDNKALFEQDMREMEQLCVTAGARVIQCAVQRRDRPVAATYLGTGKLEEIRQVMGDRECGTLVIDAELTPAQVRNIEKTVQKKVVDRSQLILDIFALHAATSEARIQVELAQMRTLYPRLTRAWTHFSQQVGGIGTRGPGEKQLEVDRRLVQKKIGDLARKLKNIEKSRTTQRASRSEKFKIALVGYTNVGKSSLLNRLCRSSVRVENKLFATLDTATRRTYLPGAGTVVMTDTVGFIRKLPHHLVASFRSTLESVLDTDLLILVMDASCGCNDQQCAAVHAVLDELGAHDIRKLPVFNKADMIPDQFARKELEISCPDALFVSAHTGDGIDTLRMQIADAVRNHRRNREMDEIIMRKTRSYRESCSPVNLP